MIKRYVLFMPAHGLYVGAIDDNGLVITTSKIGGYPRYDDPRRPCNQARLFYSAIDAESFIAHYLSLVKKPIEMKVKEISCVRS